MLAAAVPVSRANPIDGDRSTSLFRWNLVLAGLHLLQFL